MSNPQIVDAWMNLNEPGSTAGWNRNDVDVANVKDWFGAQFETLRRGTSPKEMIAEMNDQEVALGLLTTLPEIYDRGDVSSHARALNEVIERYPGRFVSTPFLSNDLGWRGAREVMRLDGEFDIAAVRTMPALAGASIDDRSYYPIYTACSERGLPITINVGYPGPRRPVELQHPRGLDRVCLDFPELTVVATHMGWPWHVEMTALLLRHSNLFLMTSAWAPEYYPTEIIDFMRSRGGKKIIFASDYPLLSLSRCVNGARSLDLSPDTKQAFLRDNALSVFGIDSGPSSERTQHG